MSVSGPGPFNPPFQRPTGDWQAFYLRYRVSPWCKVPVALLQRVTAFLTRSWTNNLYHHQRNQHPSLHHGYRATQKSSVFHSCFFNSVHLALSLQLFLTFNIKVRTESVLAQTWSVPDFKTQSLVSQDQHKIIIRVSLPYSYCMSFEYWVC